MTLCPNLDEVEEYETSDAYTIHHKYLPYIPDIWQYSQLSVLLQRQTIEQREQNRMNSSYAESRQRKTEGQTNKSYKDEKDCF